MKVKPSRHVLQGKSYTRVSTRRTVAAKDAVHATSPSFIVTLRGGECGNTIFTCRKLHYGVDDVRAL